MGIPVDGTKAEMIQKLKEKGFRSSSSDSEVLEGEFNGREVQLHVVTNNNKVYRIAVADANTVDEAEIKIRFNELCHQFENNGKYYPAEKQYISEDENILFGISLYKKRYEAIFYQKPMEQVDESKQDRSMRLVWFMISDVRYNNFRILMFYDNEYNQANGEDL